MQAVQLLSTAQNAGENQPGIIKRDRVDLFFFLDAP